MASVLIIGYGTMGAIHASKIQHLPGLQITAIIDINESRRNEAHKKGFATFIDLESAYSQLENFDIVVVTSSTAAHYENILQIINYCSTHNLQLPALFVEKPIVATTEQAEEIQRLLVTHGYPQQQIFMCGYLLRESATVQRVIQDIQASAQRITSVSVCWQKLRNPARASAGVIQDETTHALDLISYILQSVTAASTLENAAISVKEAIRSDNIINVIEQNMLYAPGHFNRKPFAEISYIITCGLINIFGRSSFLRKHKKRYITFELANGHLYHLEFDRNGADHYNGEEFKADKISLMWQSFVIGLITGQLPKHCASIEDACKDVRLTNLLESSAKQLLEERAKQPLIFSTSPDHEPQVVIHTPYLHCCCHALRNIRMRFFSC